MFSIEKIKKLLQKGVCIQAEEESQSDNTSPREQAPNDDPEADLETPLNDFTYENNNAFTINQSQFETVFNDAYSEYRKNVVGRVVSGESPWMKDICTLNAYEYTYPAEINIYEQPE